jgi:two-component system, OmpR family, sensor histidine kinase BaeS
MKLNIAQKLMIIMMLTTGIVVSLIFGLTRFNILSGFSRYLEKAELTTQVSQELERDFVAEQSRNLLLVSGVAFMVAALAAFALSRDFVRATQVLVQGTRRLIRGDYVTQIELQRSDELGQLADDFNTLSATLRQQDMAKKQWITDTSHELRTPIAVLRAQIEALQDGVQKADARTLGVLHNEIITLGKLVDDLHDLAKSDLGQLRYQFVPSDVRAVLQDAIEAFGERFSAKNITVEANGIADLHCVIEADSTRLKQLFSNLFENSLRYTNEGGRLRVSANQKPGQLVIAVEDSEPGVSQNSLAKIFDRFYRTDSSRSRVYGGAGLGLPICRAIVEAHEGTIAAHKSDLGGLNITISLPIKELKKW